jgi:hypothetical protein
MRAIIGFVGLFVVAVTSAVADTRVAFVVGNSDYEFVSPLTNPINDALDVSVALEGLGFEGRCCMEHEEVGTRPTRDGFYAVRSKRFCRKVYGLSRLCGMGQCFVGKQNGSGM